MAPASGLFGGEGTAAVCSSRERSSAATPSTLLVPVTVLPMSVLVTLDGEFHNYDAPLLHADDLAAVRGDGIFETLLVRDGQPCLLEAHLQRLAQSAKMTDLPAPDP